MNITIVFLSISMLLAPLLAGIPDEAQWSCILGAAVLSTYLAIVFQTTLSPVRRSPAALSMVALIAWTVLSTIVHAAMTRLAFLSHMLHMTTTMLTYGCAFLAMRRLAEHARGAAYAVALSAVLAATVMAVIGEQEFMRSLKDGFGMMRVNSTSTPDFLAGYMLLTIPITIGFFLAIPRGSSLFRGLASLSVLLQMAVLFQTQSRFALISLVAGFVVFVAAIFRANQAQGKRLKLSRGSVVGGTVGVLIVAILAYPVIHRLLMGGDKNSGAFRQLTWQGTVNMAKSGLAPLIGVGPGTFMDFYPKFAEAGFTRLAHNTYLQIGAEIGLPALIALVTLIFATIAAIWRVLGDSRVTETSGPLRVLADLPTNASVAIRAALLASVASEAVQNLIDSDLYVFSIGLTFFALAGMASGLTITANVDESTATPSGGATALKWLGAAAALAGAVFSICNGVAAANVASAQTLLADPSINPADAGAGYEKAMTWAPLDGKYPAEYGYRVLVQRENAIPDGISQLRYAIERQPDCLNYYRLGSTLQRSGDNAGAIVAYKGSIKRDPNYLDSLIALARITTREESLQYYRQIADLDKSPVGQVRAIGDMVEQRFAIGYVAAAQDDAAKGDWNSALKDDRRAIAILERYAIETGSNYTEREAQHGGTTSPPDDQEAATLYDTASTLLLTLITGKERDEYTQKKAYFDGRYQMIIGDAYYAIGRESEAKSYYENGLSLSANCTYVDAAWLKGTLTTKLQALGH